MKTCEQIVLLLASEFERAKQVAERSARMPEIGVPHAMSKLLLCAERFERQTMLFGHVGIVRIGGERNIMASISKSDRKPKDWEYIPRTTEGGAQDPHISHQATGNSKNTLSKISGG